VSISKAERRRRQEAERSRRYYERKKAAEAARQAEAARGEAAERRARQEAERAKENWPCAVHGCDLLAQNDIYGHWVCTGHSHELLRGRSFEELKPLNTAEDSLPGGLAPSGTHERAISHSDGEKPPSEPLESSLQRYREAAMGQRWLGTMLGFTDGRPAGTYSESGGWQAAEDPAERAAREAQIREHRQNRTWTDNDLVAFEIAVKDRMNRRNDAEAE
jgi:hypothetical protein